jgi:hypothetical protein
LNSILYLEPLHQSFFCIGIFWDKLSPAICPGWLWSVILLITASWVAMITALSHQHSSVFVFILKGWG